MNVFRRLVQTLIAFGTNAYLLFPFTLDIYKGPLKAVCHPGLNCYACPAALLSCPVGAVQNFLGTLRATAPGAFPKFGALVIGYPEEIQPYPPVALTLVNNIFAFNADPTEGGATGIYLGGGVALTEHHNLYHSRESGEITAEFLTGHDPDVTRAEIEDGTWTALTGQGQSDLTSAPLFMSGWPAVNLHLQANSPAVDAGTSVGAPADDAEGRYRDAQPDLGAYERGGQEAQVWVYLPLVLKLHP